MALTRKFLAALGIEAEKIDEIISAHTETVDALKEQLKGAGENETALKAAQTKIAELEKAVADADSAGWQKKYNEIKGEYDTYKGGVEAKAARTAKETAYKKLLLDAGVAEKRVDAILKVSNVDGVTLGDDGKIKDADKLTESVKTEWADFIVSKSERGAEVSNPPGGDGSTPPQKSRAAQLVAQYRESHYGSAKEE